MRLKRLRHIIGILGALVFFALGMGAVTTQAHTLTYDERRQFMHDHGTVGRTYAGKIWQYITGSIGLDNFEWGVTLFAETPLMFKKLLLRCVIMKPVLSMVSFHILWWAHTWTMLDYKKCF
ncbi:MULTISPECIES: chlorite dismutase family protein [Lactiplantibacillus]|uniref:chlorite dismutase family protein n=1 Tax=Lactiplantibacillus TaxID=2767842 RepID=UPI0020774E80|nr:MULTISPECIES: chlorite dismutase family protein [Lactiplantibacillus]MCM8610234.1 chlorite dismutase family protein [Lactiplantibacillus sp. B652]